MIPNNITKATYEDRVDLTKTDILCYDYPMSWESWGKVLMSPDAPVDCHVFRRHRNPLGFCVFMREPNDSNRLVVMKIGVLPSVRLTKIGTHLVDHCHNLAVSRKLDGFEITVPEYWLDKEEDRGISTFANKVGLLVDGISSDYFFHYGRKYDGIRYISRKLTAVPA